METLIERKKVKEKFLVEATEHGKAVAIGEHKKANAIHKKLQTLYKKAKEQNIADVFGEMLNDENENVRLWSAIFSLKTEPVIAEKALQELTKLTSITGLTAKTTLHIWKEGKMDLL